MVRCGHQSAPYPIGGGRTHYHGGNMAGTQTSAPSDQKSQGTPAAASVRRFRAGVQQHVETYKVYNATPATGSTTTFFDDIPSYGFLRGLVVKVTVTGGVGSGTAAVYKEDAPFSWINQIQLQDVNSVNIIAIVTGYDLYLMYKYGGYFTSADPKSAEEYSQGGIGGNSVFILYVPLE